MRGKDPFDFREHGTDAPDWVRHPLERHVWTAGYNAALEATNAKALRDGLRALIDEWDRATADLHFIEDSPVIAAARTALSEAQA